MLLAFQVMEGVKEITKNVARFTDGQEKEIDSVILATGYKSNVPSWLKVNMSCYIFLVLVLSCCESPITFCLGHMHREPETYKSLLFSMQKRIKSVRVCLGYSAFSIYPLFFLYIFREKLILYLAFIKYCVFSSDEPFCLSKPTNSLF